MRFPISKPTITELEESYVADAVSSGWVSSAGDYILQFEEGFARFCEVDYCVSVSSGTTGLFLALKALGIGEGDEVIVPDFSFIATANAVKQAGATPVFVDIDLNTLCIDPITFESAITTNTRAVIPVHIYGHPAPMPEIIKTARAHDILIIEDCAEAHGAAINDIPVGGWGDVGVFSFYGNKMMTTGEGGAIVLKDEGLAAKLKMLRDHAMSPTRRYWHEEIGYNFRITNLQAALGVAQLERVKDIIQKKQEICSWYLKKLAGIDGIRLNYKADWAQPVYWMICIELVHGDIELRDKLMKELGERGVDSRPYFYPMSDMPMYSSAETPKTHHISKIGLNLPSYYDLQQREVDEICGVIRESLICLGY